MQAPARTYGKANLRPVDAPINFAAASPEHIQHRVEDLRVPRTAILTARH